MFNSNTNQNVVNSTVIYTKVPNIIIFTMIYYVLYKFYELKDLDPKFCKKPHLDSDPDPKFILDSLQP